LEDNLFSCFESKSWEIKKIFSPNGKPLIKSQRLIEKESIDSLTEVKMPVYLRRGFLRGKGLGLQV
jgi:hypothetical protein